MVSATGRSMNDWGRRCPCRFKIAPLSFDYLLRVNRKNLFEVMNTLIDTITLDYDSAYHKRHRVPGIRVGRVLTRDRLDGSDRTLRYNQYKADAIEMESGGIAQVCRDYEIPFIAIRGISDTDEDWGTQLQEYAGLAMRNVLRVVEATLRES